MEVASPESFTGTSEAISRPRQATHPQRGCRRRGREKMTTVQLWITAGVARSIFGTAWALASIENTLDAAPVRPKLPFYLTRPSIRFVY